MRRDTSIQLIALAVMLCFMTGAGVFATKIASSIGRNRLVYADRAEAGDPPQVALGIAMGAFRGMFVNFLWIRANDLKEQGKYFEAIDLAKTITRLQPRFPKVWQFHAWNLAYNISVSTQTPEERWNWIQSAIRLLRDEGIPANPSDINLHRELAWTYLHKVQGYMDDAHVYYKKQVAHEFTIVMGRPPPLSLEQLGDTGDAKKLYADRWLQPIVDAPNTLDELYEKEPAARELVALLKSRANMDPDKRLLERVALNQSVFDTTKAIGLSITPTAEPLTQLMSDPRFSTAGRALVNYTRKRVLIDQYHMEPDRMLRYTRKYGPIDWRHPAAHALYWAARGVEESYIRVNAENEKDADFVNTDRLTVQAVQELFRTGSIFYDITNPDFYLALPNSEFIDTYKGIILEVEGRSHFDGRTRSYGMYSAGYENFMRDAIRVLYRRGDKDAAIRYQKELIAYPGLNTNNPNLFRELGVPIDEFVTNEITKDNRETSPGVALQEVSSSLQLAYINGLLAGNDKVFRGAYGYAKLFHATYQDTQAFKTWIAGNAGRMGMPPFDTFAAQVFAQLIQFAGVPQGPVMYHRAPPDLQGRTYAILERSPIKQGIDQAAQANKDAITFNVWFPEPPNMPYYRQVMFPDQPKAEQGTVEMK